MDNNGKHHAETRIGVPFVPLVREPFGEAAQLITANPLAFVLLSVMALRSHKGGFSPFGLQFGESLLGDCRKYGMSEKEYRTAKKHLEKWQFAAFRGTNKGTIGRIINTRVFALVECPKGEQNGDHGATTGRGKGEQRASNLDLIRQTRNTVKVLTSGKALSAARDSRVHLVWEVLGREHPDCGKWVNRIKGSPPTTQRDAVIAEPNKVERVLAQVRMDKLEGKAFTSGVGAYAEDLWQRWP